MKIKKTGCDFEAHPDYQYFIQGSYSGICNTGMASLLSFYARLLLSLFLQGMPFPIINQP